MQKAGEKCESCKPRWSHKRKPFKTLEALDGLTLVHEKPVPACPYCDGAIIQISKLGNHDDDLEWED